MKEKLAKKLLSIMDSHGSTETKINTMSSTNKVKTYLQPELRVWDSENTESYMSNVYYLLVRGFDSNFQKHVKEQIEYSDRKSIFHDAIMKFFRRYKDMDSPIGLYKKILHDESISYIRRSVSRSKRSCELVDIQDGKDYAIDTDIAESSLKTNLKRKINIILEKRPEYKKLYEYKLRGLKEAEIVDIMKISKRTIRNRFKKLKDICRSNDKSLWDSYINCRGI